MRQDPAARITPPSRSWGDFHLFRLDAPDIAAEAKPGQFVMIRVGETPDPLLRRPISLHAKEGGASSRSFSKSPAEGTALLAAETEGETLDILGPLGRGFNLAPDVRGKTAFLVGGGRGIAPLYFLGRELEPGGRPVRVLYGGRTAARTPRPGKIRGAPARNRLRHRRRLLRFSPASSPAFSKPKSRTPARTGSSSAGPTR